MIELSRHIERLLLEHNCVIVPNLGGFVAQDCSARYVVEQNLFLPPYRNVAFNPLLQLNDGLLAQSYMQCKGTSYTETLRDIDRAVADLKHSIELKQAVELSGIGTLRLTEFGQYDFKPIEGGIVAPHHYALDSFSAAPLHTEADEQTQTAETPELVATHSDRFTFSIRKSVLRYAAVVLVALFCVAGWHSGMGQQLRSTSTEANFFESLQKLFASSNQREYKVSPAPKKVVKLPEAAAIDNAEAAEEEPLIASRFAVVLASGITEEGAHAFVDRLVQDSIPDVYVFQQRKMVRVMHGHYASYDEALQAMRQLRAKSKAFADSWILEQ